MVLSEEHGESSVVVLREEHGERILPIAVGYCEAATIQRLLAERVDGRIALRPLTHELLIRAIGGLRGRIERGIITRLEQETFFAQLILRQDSPPGGTDEPPPSGRADDRSEIALDARPSDVICVCLAAGCRLYALRSLLEQVTDED